MSRTLRHADTTVVPKYPMDTSAPVPKCLGSEVSVHPRHHTPFPHCRVSSRELRRIVHIELLLGLHCVHTLWLYSLLVNLPTNQLTASQVADWWSHWLVNLSTTNSHGKTSLYLCINNPHHDPAANPNNKRLHKSLFSEKMKIHGVSE